MVASSASSAGTRRRRRPRKPQGLTRVADDCRSDRAAPTHMGGQAVIEGVMMRGADHWAVAVREPDGDDRRRVARHRVGRRPDAILRKPVRARRDRARRVAGARHPRADLVGEPVRRGGGAARPSARSGVVAGDRDGRRSSRSSSCCPRSRSPGLEGRARPRRRHRPRRSRACSGVGDLPRLPVADRAHEGHPPRVRVPRGRAQDDRRLRERRASSTPERSTAIPRSTCAAAPTSCSS